MRKRPDIRATAEMLAALALAYVWFALLTILVKLLFGIFS